MATKSSKNSRLFQQSTMVKLSQEDEAKRQANQSTYEQNIVTQYGRLEAYKIDSPDMGKPKRVIKQLQRRSAPGPDNIPAEIIKELEEANLELLLS